MGPSASIEREVVFLPHRWARGCAYAVFMTCVGLLIAGPFQATRTSKIVLLIVCAGLLVLVEFRTARLRLELRAGELLAHGIFLNRRVDISKLDIVDVDSYRTGAFTPGGGARLVAVLHDGRRKSLSFDFTRRAHGHCPHYSSLVRKLNDELRQRQREPVR